LFSPEEEQAVQDALLTSCKLLEEARCIESEREANLMMATSMLAHHGQADVDVSNLPGGVQDAWALLSEASQRGISTTSATAVISAAMGGDSKLLRLQQMDMERDAGVPTNNTGNDAATLPIGQGQLGKVTTMTTLAACIRRTGSVSDTLAKERRSRDGKVLKNALQTAKSKLSLIDPLSAPTPSTSTHESMAATTNLWLNIMDRRLKEIRSYHAKNDQYMDATSASQKRTASLTTSRATSLNSKRPRLGNPAADGYDLASSVLESLEGIRDGTLFSAEEVMGKYLDLRPLYEEHAVPIKNLFTEVVQTDRTKVFGFSDFLAVLSKGEGGLIEGISESSKLKERKKYVRFLVALETYLKVFLKRTQPLLPETQVAQPAIQEFINEWREKGGSLGWEAKPAEASMVMDDDEKDDIKSSIHGIDLSSYKSAGDLEKAVDGDALKAELTRLGLKCGGTVADRAKRLFMTKDTPLDQLPKKLFAKKTAPQGNDGSASASANVNLKNERRVDIAKREVIVVALLNQLKPTLEATMRRTERRETQTSREREKEIDEDLHGSAIEGPKLKGASNGEDSDDDSDEDGPIYNPKGVPLGWDGKPIPYWLFKLHGLNHFYQCEICGNESYRGRRNFETHFAEARHAFGMKSLGIPNTKHFHGVTRIEDALNLWEKLKDQLQEEQFDGSKEEEYEDSHGNVLSRATYEDLARQGLL
jgi:splicing factor 3A subunit 3